VLPGVTVSVSSPALQVPSLTTISETDGTYRITDLPAGVYEVVYDLPGFTKIVRKDIRITTGFLAKLDAVLTVGGLEETITVSGGSPIVDVSATSTGATLTRDLVEAIPRSKEFSTLLAMTPGVTAAGAPDVGGSNLAARTAADAFGIAQQPRLTVEGINIGTGSGTNSGVVFSSYNFDEVKVSTSGADAETSTPGISVQAIIKSGSNQLRGTAETHGQWPQLQSSNLTEEAKAQGVTAGNALDTFYGYAFDLGGRIVRDKLWYYVGWNRQTRVEQQLGFVDGPGADGKYLTGDEPPGLVHTTLDGSTAKLSYQMSKKVKLIGVYQRGAKVIPEFNADRFTPRESLDNYLNPTGVWKGEMQTTLSDQLLVNANGGWGGYIADHNCARGAEEFFGTTTGLVSRQYLETGQITGPCTNTNYRWRSRYQLDSSITYFPKGTFAGHHEFKTGESIYWEDIYSQDRAMPWGSINHVYDIVNGVSSQPFSVTLYSNPTDLSSKPDNRLDTVAIYLKDTWRISNDFTANLGVRYERQHSFVPAQAYVGTPEWPTVFPAKTFGMVDVMTWNKVMPRVGIAYQVFAKSVLKGTWGVYADTAGDDFASAYNGNATQTASFRWHDVNGNSEWDDGESNLALNNNPDFINITSAANNIMNKDLRQPTTVEMSLAWEQELTPTMAIHLQGVSKRVRDSYVSVNVLRPYDAYSNIIIRTDPGPDGVTGNGDDGGPVTLYDYRNEFRGAAFVGNEPINSSDPDQYYSIESGVSKRMSNNWQASVSYFATKRDSLIDKVIANPNQELFNRDQTWTWGSNVTALVQLPWALQLASFVQAKSGTQGERSYVFRAIPNASTITRRLGQRGTLNNPNYLTTNLKLSRKFRVTKGANLDLTLDAFNIFNTATATGITKASGPTYGYITGILAPRIAQVGAKFTF